MLDLKGKRVAVLAGGVQAQGFKSMMADFDVSVTLVPVKSFDDVFAAVADQRADAGVVNSLFGGFNAVKVGLVGTPVVFQPAKLFFGVL